MSKPSMCRFHQTVSTRFTKQTSIADTCIPHYEATIRPNNKHFMNSVIRHKMNVRDRYWKQYQQTNLDEHHDKFKEM